MEPNGNPAVAIVGMAAIMPEAPDAAAFWDNIVQGRYCISDVPPGRWDPERYYDPDPLAVDKTYSRIGGWVREFDWDPLGWRLPIPPKVAEQLDVGQQWAINLTRAALADAGWEQRTADPERVAVIVGNAIGGEKHYATNLRIQFPDFAAELAKSPTFASLRDDVRAAIIEEARKEMSTLTPPVTEDTMPGELANCIAGRIANLFDFRGPNFTTDAACASALAALTSAIQGLTHHQYDVAITGGIDRNMGVGAFVKFCKIGALSATGTRPYADGADGFVMGEGGALFVVKRLADAERDGDRIYAVVRGIAGSSDGKGKGITAPNPIGQRLAVERAWRNAGLDPRTASLIEGHGTSTRVGDVVEIEALQSAFGVSDLPAGSIALGSVKSNIGHLKAAAGAAGLFKAAMALATKVLPPSLNCATPNPAFDWGSSPFRVNTELREWSVAPDQVRTAGVSAFGFGGTNFHAVLEEYVPGGISDGQRAIVAVATPEALTTTHAGGGAESPAGAASRGVLAMPRHPGKPPLRGALLLGGATTADIATQLETVARDAEAGRVPPRTAPAPELVNAAVRLAVDYGDAVELATKVDKVRRVLDTDNAQVWKMLRAQGVFLGRGAPPKVAFLYTGQGSQYVNMLADLRAIEPLVADTFAEADRVMTPLLGRPLSDFIFIDAGDPTAVARLEQQLLQTEITQPAVLAVDTALTRLLAAYGIRPDMVMGHSLGEYGALVAAGALTFPAALEAVSARGREMAQLSVEDNGAMAAVLAPLDDVQRLVEQIDGYVVLANINSPNQTVIGGATAAVEEAVARLHAAGATVIRLPVSHAFHTQIVAPASVPLREALLRLGLTPPTLPIVANVDGDFYPTSGDVPAQMLDVLARQVASPVQFVKGLHTLYDAGARVFVEVGPKRALFGFTEDVLGAAHGDVLALFTNHPKQGDVLAFNQALCGLYAAGLGLAEGPAAPPVEVSAPAPAVTTTTGPAMTEDRYAQVGRLFADLLAQGRQLLDSPPASDAAAPAVDAEPIVITGAGLGLPGTEHVFDDCNVARILAGESLIGALPQHLRERIADKGITRLVKRDIGDPTFEAIDSVDDVIKLAGRLGAFDVAEDFGVDPARAAALDVTDALAIAVGFEALRDAGIPLVMHYKDTTVGTRLPDRWGLPDALRDDTGVVFASAFPGYDAFAQDLDRYHEDRARREQLAALREVRRGLDAGARGVADLDARIAELQAQIAGDGFAFDRRFLFRALSMGHSQFAEIIGARGPNTQINAACASTTQALAVAEDWIRMGRCRRVIVVSADDVTSEHLMPWAGSGFLASGAAATDAVVEDAALPFDARRHGMLMGAGAAAVVVEQASAARERGIQPICEIVSTVTANSAFHGTRLDVEHICDVMETLVRQAEAKGVNRHDMASRTAFVSHETYTPARGGSAAAEINALRHVFGADADSIVITNTKGFTGHAMGAGVEDVVAVTLLETGVVPPVANFKQVDPELGQLNLSKGGAYPVEYALRLAAGFGSQIAMALLRWTPAPDGARRTPDALGYEGRIVDRGAWQRWLDDAAGHAGAQLEVDRRRLRVVTPGLAETPSVAPLLGGFVPDAARTHQETAPPAAPAVVAEAVAGPDPGERVVALVAELTGYPPELLDLDLDLEADLGVDTVKQAEVFAAVRGEFGIERDETLQLRDFPTLAHVIGFVADRAPVAPLLGGFVPDAARTHQETAPAAPGIHVPPPMRGDLAATDTITRRVPAVVARPDRQLCKPTGITLQGARVVVMRDEGGAAEPLEARLSEAGAEALPVDPGVSADSLTAQLDAWLTQGPIAGVYWLAALDDEGPLAQLDLADWREALRRRVKNLYATMRRLHASDPFLVGATRLGGFHGYDAAGAVAPLGGAVTGFVKAYGRERTAAFAKAVDFAAAAQPDDIAAALLAETLFDPGAVEIGVTGDDRWSVALREAPFGNSDTGHDASAGMTLDHDMVFCVTGAAGSIVSAITADLAAASGGVFHLLDLTPRPDPADADLQHYVRDRDGFKTVVAERMRAAGQRPTPVLIEKELARFERLQMALAAIQAVEDAGGEACYHAVDLTDPAAVAQAVHEIAQRHGRIDVLLHAAGMEISRSLADKEPREYDLVFDVKSDGWFNLLSAAPDLPIGATVAFSSIAGRFGNAGQTDYSAANDLLCKIASSFRRTRPDTRAIALDWTAWGGIGMATRGSIPKVMEMAGIDLLPPEAGVAWIRRELTAGNDRGEVVVAGNLGILAQEPDATGGLDPDRCSTAAARPMVGRIIGLSLHQGVRVETPLNPKTQPFLNHHRIDGTAVLPGVMGIEAFAETARALLPDWHVTGVEDVAFLAPFKLYRDDTRPVTITAQLWRDGDDVVADCRLDGSRTLPGHPDPQWTTHFTGRVRLSRHAPEHLKVDPPDDAGLPHATSADIYRVYFHGPAYQVVETAWRSNGGPAGRLTPALPPGHLPESSATLMAPRLIELCFQTAGLWEIARHGRLALPQHVRSVQVLMDQFEATPPIVAVATPTTSGFDCRVVDADGKVLVLLEGYTTVALPGGVDDAVRAPLRDAMG